MRRFLAFLGLLLALGAGQAAYAYPLGAKASILTANPCANRAVNLEFTKGLFCVNGRRAGQFTDAPGISFTRASSKTCQSVAQAAAGTFTTVAAGVPCITDQGILLEESRTNSFLNSAIGVTQTVTTTATSWTLSFWGTGKIVESGTCSGTLNGTGATTRVSLTVTATAGSCVLTVTGSTANVQMEAGPFASSYIATTGSAVTRAADVITLTATFPPQGTIVTGLGFVTNSGVRNEIWSFSDSGNSRMAVRSTGAGTDPTAAVGNGTTISSFGTTVPPAVGTISKVGLAYNTAAAVAGFAVNGADYSSTASAVQAVAATIALPMYIGSLGGSNQYDGYIRSLAVYPIAYTGSQLQGLTQ